VAPTLVRAYGQRHLQFTTAGMVHVTAGMVHVTAGMVHVTNLTPGSGVSATLRHADCVEDEEEEEEEGGVTRGEVGMQGMGELVRHRPSAMVPISTVTPVDIQAMGDAASPGSPRRNVNPDDGGGGGGGGGGRDSHYNQYSPVNNSRGGGGGGGGGGKSRRKVPVANRGGAVQVEFS
jgi:hypothetical protein